MEDTLAKLISLDIGLALVGILTTIIGWVYLSMILRQITTIADRIADRTEMMWVQLRRQYGDIDQDLQEIRDLVRG